MNIKITTLILRILFILIVAISVIGNIYCVSQGHSDWSAYLLLSSSAILTLVIFQIFKLTSKSDKSKQLNSNLKAAQQLIYNMENKVSLGLRRLSVQKDFSLITILEQPLNSVICVFLFLSFFITELYKDFDIGSSEKVVKLILISFVQLALMGFVISAVALPIYKKIKGKTS